VNTDDAIVEDPNVMRGVPVFKGTRVPIANVLASLKAGFHLEQLREAYSFLTQEHVDAALNYVPRQIAESGQPRATRPIRGLLNREVIQLPSRRK
jgi:uncharacterized protein (DUF433 family)